MQHVNLGQIGASKIAAKILPYMRAVDAINIVGVAARDIEKAKLFAGKHKIPTAYSSYSDLLADKNIHAVYISVLNSDHSALIRKSLEAGKHVLCEKPLVINDIDAVDLYKIAADSNLILLEGLMYRFHPQIQKMNEALVNASIGELKSIRVDFSFLLHDLENRAARASSHGGGGALNDLGCYAIDFILRAARTTNAGSIVSLVAHQLRDSEIDLMTSAMITFESGLGASFTCAINQCSANTWELRGSAGSIAGLRFDPQGVDRMPTYLINDESESNLIACEQGTQFKDEFQNFADSVLGRSQPFVLPNESIEVAAVMSRIRLTASGASYQ